MASSSVRTKVVLLKRGAPPCLADGDISMAAWPEHMLENRREHERLQRGLEKICMGKRPGKYEAECKAQQDRAFQAMLARVLPAEPYPSPLIPTIAKTRAKHAATVERLRSESRRANSQDGEAA